jgi:hypothetical protein
MRQACVPNAGLPLRVQPFVARTALAKVFVHRFIARRFSSRLFEEEKAAQRFFFTLEFKDF